MICLDSDCIIDFLRGKKEAVEAVEKNKDDLATTEINLFEVYFGIYQKNILNENEELQASEFFNSLNVLPFDSGCGQIASKILTSLIKEGKTIQHNDALIASILQKNNASTIITNNVKHFSHIKGLKVISYMSSH